MIVELFDVELGQCVVITCPNGKKVMIDSGQNTTRDWYPSKHFKGQDIHQFIISNFDEDHVSDFMNLTKDCRVQVISRNASINSSRLVSLKQFGMGPGVRAVYNWMKETEKFPIFPELINLGEVRLSHYCNKYGVFKDTNNLSLVTFVHYGSFTMLFPGDLEIDGWRELLKSEVFSKELKSVTVFVASHHGRENGFCEEVFKYCSPKVIIISDASKQHSTQETCDRYRYKAKGYQTVSGEPRKVFTTRKDGHILLKVNEFANWTIATEVDKMDSAELKVGRGIQSSIHPLASMLLKK